MIEYGSEILAARSRRRITQSALARHIGIFDSTLVDIERGRIGVDDDTYRRFLDAIDAIESADAEPQEQAA